MAPEAEEQRIEVIWAAALAVAALGTWLVYDANPGLNWFICTATAAAGLLLFLRRGERSRSSIITMGVVATLISGGAAITADEFMTVLIALGIISFLALEMLLTPDPGWNRFSASFAIPAPAVAFGHAIVESVRRAVEALHLVRSNRARSVLGGLAITLPVLIVFALLLASADPVFASWRNALEELIANWDFLPRTIFFLALLSMVLGAYGFTAKGDDSVGLSLGSTPDLSRRWLGVTERLILIGSVAGLLWLFLLVQLSYLFGNLPQVTGSGMTFAEYARRGFGELTVVASGSALIILVSEKFGKKDHRETLLRSITLALVLAVLFLLASAFHRVWLYEEAYGFTTARLYAQAFMIIIAFGLLALAAEVRGEIDTRRLFRRVAAVGTISFLVLLYWNHQAWIAARNIERFATTGKLDVSYIVRELGPNAVPVLIDRLPTLPPATSTEILSALDKTYSDGRPRLTGSWYEWNLARSRAKAALEKASISYEPKAKPVPTN